MGLPVLTEEKIALVEGRLNHEWHERGVSCFVAFAPFRHFRVSESSADIDAPVEGGLISLLGELFSEEVANRQDGNTCVFAQIQEMVVTRYNAGSIGDNGTVEENVIVRVGNHDAHSSLRSSLTSNLVDNLVDLFQGQWLLLWRLRHNPRHRRRRDTLEV